MFSRDVWDEDKSEWNAQRKYYYTLLNVAISKFILLSPLLRPSELVGRYDIDKARLVFIFKHTRNTKHIYIDRQTHSLLYVCICVLCTLYCVAGLHCEQKPTALTLY